MRVHDFFESKIKGADGKACWKGYRYNGTKNGKDSCVKVDEARADVNFDAEDLKRLERISDLETLKAQAFGLISKPSAKPMKPEKVAWFKQALAGKSNKIAVIKMMYDLMLSGEGNSVIGSKNSMNPNSYRKVFNSATSEGITENAEELDIGDDVIITGNVEFNGKTGVIDSFGQDKRFVIVNLYNHGKHSFHSSDVSVNDYAGSDEEESRMAEAYQNDEANLWYIYDKTDGLLKQKMIANLDEPQARQMGYRDSMDAALRVANIIRSKFDAKKYVQKQGNQWVPVYPFGKPNTSETAMDPRLQRYIDNNPDEVSDSIDTLRDRANAEGGRFKWAIGKLPDGRFVLGLQGNIKMLGLPMVDQGISEAKTLHKRVKIVKGPSAGKYGYIREIKHGAHKSAAKAYYIDIEGGGQANNLPATALRMAKEQNVAEASWVNGKLQQPEDLVWKQTSLSYEEAVRKYGKDAVRKEGKNRIGQEVIAVHVPLGGTRTPALGEDANDNAYGYKVGQTVKLPTGGQGRVIDIFDDAIEVQLTNGQSITVDFRDAQVIGEQGVAESEEDLTPNWAKYVLDQIYNSNGAVTMTDLFDEGIPGLRDMFMATAEELGLDPDEDFQDVESEVLEKLDDIIKGGHGMDEAYSSPPPFKDMIASVYHPRVGDKIRTRKGGQIPGTVEKVADHNGIEYCWFRHPEGKLYKTPCSNVMRG